MVRRGHGLALAAPGGFSGRSRGASAGWDALVKPGFFLGARWHGVHSAVPGHTGAALDDLRATRSPGFSRWSPPGGPRDPARAGRGRTAKRRSAGHVLAQLVCGSCQGHFTLSETNTRRWPRGAESRHSDLPECRALNAVGPPGPEHSDQTLHGPFWVPRPGATIPAAWHIAWSKRL